MSKNLVQRVAMVFIGVLIMGFAVSLLIYANLGTDSASCMNLGVSSKIGLSLGLYQLIFNSLVLVFTFIFARHFIGIGTIINMVFVGFLVDFFNATLIRSFPSHPGMPMRVIVMLIAVVVLSFSASLYIHPHLGISPYDSIAFMVAERTHIQFRWLRIVCDMTALLIGWLCGSVIGLGTVVSAFCIGPLIKFFSDLLQKKIPFEPS
jgi:uncharacterized protein